MTKKIITPVKEASDLEIKLQKENVRLEKKVDCLERDLLKSEVKYLKLELEVLALRKKILESVPPEGLADALKKARERVRKHLEPDEQDKRPQK